MEDLFILKRNRFLLDRVREKLKVTLLKKKSFSSTSSLIVKNDKAQKKLKYYPIWSRFIWNTSNGKIKSFLLHADKWFSNWKSDRSFIKVKSVVSLVCTAWTLFWESVSIWLNKETVWFPEL